MVSLWLSGKTPGSCLVTGTWYHEHIPLQEKTGVHYIVVIQFSDLNPDNQPRLTWSLVLLETLTQTLKKKGLGNIRSSIVMDARMTSITILS